MAEAAGKLLLAKLTRPSILKTMKMSHISGGFWMGGFGSCSDFLSALPKEVSDLALEHQNEHWPVRWLVGNYGLSGGWRTFAMDHKLLENDCVVFERKDDVVIKMYIFRHADYEDEAHPPADAYFEDAAAVVYKNRRLQSAIKKEGGLSAKRKSASTGLASGSPGDTVSPGPSARRKGAAQEPSRFSPGDTVSPGHSGKIKSLTRLAMDPPDATDLTAGPSFDSSYGGCALQEAAGGSPMAVEAAGSGHPGVLKKAAGSRGPCPKKVSAGEIPACASGQDPGSSEKAGVADARARLRDRSELVPVLKPAAPVSAAAKMVKKSLAGKRSKVAVGGKVPADKGGKLTKKAAIKQGTGVVKPKVVRARAPPKKKKMSVWDYPFTGKAAEYADALKAKYLEATKDAVRVEKKTGNILGGPRPGMYVQGYASLCWTWNDGKYSPIHVIHV